MVTTAMAVVIQCALFRARSMPNAPARRRQCNHTDDGNVLIMVRHQGIFHEAHVGKTHHRHKRHTEKPPGKQKRPTPTFSILPQHGCNDKRRR